jgi:hypothetical protein
LEARRKKHCLTIYDSSRNRTSVLLGHHLYGIIESRCRPSATSLVSGALCSWIYLLCNSLEVTKKRSLGLIMSHPGIEPVPCLNICPPPIYRKQVQTICYKYCSWYTFELNISGHTIHRRQGGERVGSAPLRTRPGIEPLFC